MLSISTSTEENKCHFLQIPQDVFVDDIFPYLLIDDLLAAQEGMWSPNLPLFRLNC
jgi:hypothetical protein